MENHLSLTNPHKIDVPTYLAERNLPIFRCYRCGGYCLTFYPTRNDCSHCVPKTTYKSEFLHKGVNFLFRCGMCNRIVVKVCKSSGDKIYDSRKDWICIMCHKRDDSNKIDWKCPVEWPT